MHTTTTKQRETSGGRAENPRRDTTPVVERNGGMHRQKAFRRVKAMFDGHGYRRPRLYHLVLMADIEATDAAPFLKALKALVLRLREFNIETRWRAALERDGEKGMHMHVFVLADATCRNPCGIINGHTSAPGATPRRRSRDGKPRSPHGWMRDMFARHGIRFHLSQPKADRHRVGGTVHGSRRNYAIPDTPDSIADCIEWASYLVKARSKPDDIRGIYFSSRDGVAKKRQPKTLSAKVIGEHQADGSSPF